MRYVALVGRVLYGAVVVMAAFGHLSQQLIEYAARHGVPAPVVVASLSAVIAGGLCVLLGYRARTGAALLVLFLVPATVMVGAFRGVHDPVAAQLQQAMFMNDVLLLVGALLIVCVGAGPLSVDTIISALARRTRMATLRTAGAHL
jgi:putative oxidoreductase